MINFEFTKRHPGQINLQTSLGKKIFNLVNNNKFKTIVDIGTWNGLGTTSCVLEAMKNSNNYNTVLYTLELYEEMYNIAKENLKEFLLFDNFYMLNGKIIDYEDIFWFDHKSIDFNNDEHAKKWFLEDLKKLFSAKNVLNTIPDKIDLLILDGGEYTTYPEWLKLKDRVNYFILDDTLTLKCKKIRQEIINDDKYIIFEDVLDERNGYLIGKYK